MEIKQTLIKKYALSIGLLYLLTPYAFSESSIPSQVNFHIGSISVNYAENTDNLAPSDSSVTTTKSSPYTGTASSMPFAIAYEYFPGLSRSYFVRAAGPLMGSTPDRYYNTSMGVNFYFGQFASQAVIKDVGMQMKVMPKFRYFAGASLGLGYLVYNTKSATKNDILFELGAQGGILYSLGPKWSISAELGGARAIGSLTSATVIKILLGTSYTLDLWSTK